jgi:3-phenylpropionate/trans-cinnamate dioxygenase ferredoxin subunit
MTFEFAMTLADLPEKALRACELGGREIVLCHSQAGIFALDNVCTHAFARLCEGRLRGVRLICPLHGASFDVRDGHVLGAPATQPLVTHQVRIVDGKIEVAINPASSA